MPRADPPRPCRILHRSRTAALAAARTPFLALLLGALVSTAPGQAQGQSATLVGRVAQPDDRPVAYARVGVDGSLRGVVADEEGRFRLTGLPPGEHILRVSAQGYAVARRTVAIPHSGEPVTIVLTPDPVALEALTVTGTRKETAVGESPVKVQIVPTSVLQRNATNNLTEAVQYVNGLYTQVDCGVCYTNNIRINGMAGPYTAILIDGMPLMSSLASVYGLNGINPAIIEQLEIVKGPSSTLYGSEAMAGVVNVITKDPRFTPRWTLDVSATSDAEANVDFAVASEPGDLTGLVSGNVSYNDRFVDENEDGFSDFPLVRRGVLFAKGELSEEGQRRGGLTARYLFEDRFGGVEAWERAHRGSDSLYGESVVTHRVELIGSWLPGWSDRLRVEGSYTFHHQDSYYGDVHYLANQHVAFANLLWGERRGPHDLLVGATARYQVYDDDTPATAESDRRLIPGLLVQDEVEWSSGLSTLGGLRADHHAEHGIILSPRFAAKWQPWERTTLRLNAGTGFRVVNLFTEDHAALTGSREVVIASELEPERSRSVTLNLNQVVEFGPSPMMIDLDVFHTRFSNKIVPDYDRDPNLIVYDNLAGHAVSRGISLALNQNVDFERFLYTVGVTLQDVYAVEDGVERDEFFAPRVRAVASATYDVRSLPLSVDYTASLTGPMRMPSFDEPFARPERSPTYSVHNLQANWRLGEGSQLYLSMKNLFDYAQPTPLIDPERPFGDAFDTTYVYGPLRGRYLMLGLRQGIGR